jgi:hypothetical protein
MIKRTRWARAIGAGTLPNPHHFTKVHDMRLGCATEWTPTRDWRQVARAARGALKREDARTRTIVGATRAMWSVSRRLRDV